CYHAHAFFHTTPRRAADFWFALRRAVAVGDPGGDQYDVLLDELGVRLQRSLQEDPRLSPAGRQLFLRAVKKDAAGVWNVDPTSYTTEPECPHRFSIPFPSEHGRRRSQAQSARLVMHARGHTGWSITPYQREGGRSVRQRSSGTGGGTTITYGAA